MRIGFSAEGARRAVNEIITGLWSFTNASGLLTDDIGEVGAGAGVTVDGLLIRDAGIPEAAVTAHEAALAILEAQIVDGTLLARLAANETVAGSWRFNDTTLMVALLEILALATAGSTALRTNVTGDANFRFAISANGQLTWGSGAAGGDTILRRNAADDLICDDAFTVAGRLALQNNFHLSEADLTLTTGAKNNQVTGTSTIIRILLSTGVVNITGFAGGGASRMLIIINLGGSNLTLNDEDSNSTAANRMLFTGATDLVLAERDVAILWYDDNTSRWRLLGTTV